MKGGGEEKPGKQRSAWEKSEGYLSIGPMVAIFIIMVGLMSVMFAPMA